MRARPLAMAPIRDHRRIIAVLLLLLYLPACTSWQVGTTSPEQLFEDDPPDKCRITLTDGSEVELMSPVIRADSLVGTPKGDSVRVAIPLSEVLLVEVRKPNNKGLIIAVSIVVLVGVVVYQVANDALFPDGPP